MIISDQDLYVNIFLSTLSTYELKCIFLILHLNSNLTDEKEYIEKKSNIKAHIILSQL